MIKFFRNIRKYLLNEGLPAGQAGKTSKYLKYAIGEIVLVVIGILIALSINTWNEERKAKAIVVNVLKNIRYDLVADTLTFSKHLLNIPINLEMSKSLLDNIGLDTQSASSLYDRLPYNGYVYRFKNQSYEKVINAGITDFFDFNLLFDDINTYYTLNSNMYDGITKWDTEDTTDDGKLWAAMGFEIDIYANPYYNQNEITFEQSETSRKAVFLEQLNTPTIRNSIKSNMYRKIRLQELLMEIKQIAKDIIQKIDEQLIENK